MINKKYIRFPEGKKKAFTLSYDDAVDQDQLLVQWMKEYDVKGTFNISSGWLAEEGTVYDEGETHRRMSVSQCIECYKEDVVEVATHGFTHPFLTTLDQGMMLHQLIEDRKQLEDMFGRIVKGMAYPYGVYDRRVIEGLGSAGIQYCRTVNSTGNFSIPENWLAWNPTCHHDDEKLMDLAERFLQESPNDSPFLFYVWGHTFEFERNDNWNRMKELLSKVAGKEDVWYATNGEIYQYVEAYNRLEFSVEGKVIYNPSALNIWVEIDNELIHIAPGATVVKEN